MDEFTAFRRTFSKQECTFLAGQAVDYTEGATFKYTNPIPTQPEAKTKNVTSLHLKAEQYLGHI
ncbi:hypothetical protein [Shewanella sp. UCD-KL12]|uniref:hypothetical protein n=1 Tax=Shewanella sp. UCD-KL12 TaxID=1917163 RepID=UPI0009706984|nr:hypothetical protein [Shewanella sp. UCD-KL12]